MRLLPPAVRAIGWTSFLTDRRHPAVVHGAGLAFAATAALAVAACGLLAGVTRVTGSRTAG